jgi:hypothetical protein
MADQFNREAYRSFEAMGCWCDHRPDGAWNKNHAPGRADFLVGHPQWGMFAVEVKTGKGAHRQNWSFAEWKPEQRNWAAAFRQKGFEYWLFITVGTIIPRGKNHQVKYPRFTTLLPSELVLRIEADSDRKSLSYEQIAVELAGYRLEWAGNQRWVIPKGHPFWNSRKGTHERNSRSGFKRRAPVRIRPTQRSCC